MRQDDRGQNDDPGCESAARRKRRFSQDLSVTLPPEVYEQLIQESARRKIAGEPNQLLSALLREAIMDYLKRLEK